MNLSHINTNTLEGRLLIAALGKLTGELHTDKEPNEALCMCLELANRIYEGNPLPEPSIAPRISFESALEDLINRYSKENESNTPDFILSDYLIKCLKAFNETSLAREKWYGKSLKII